jgi:peptidoglycan/xylan/chitin deacetylase (PgdA/CDA1 family)
MRRHRVHEAKAVIREAARSVAGSAASTRLVSLLERLDRPHPHAMAVLMYHRVIEPGEVPTHDPTVVSTTPAQFEEQIAFLAANVPLLSLDELLAVRRGQAQAPPGAVVITFDDAYYDFAAHAWPVLRRHGVPATLFVPTGFPDDPKRPFWWDHLHHALVTTGRRDGLATPWGVLPLRTETDRAETFRLLRDRLKATPHHEAMALLDGVAAELGVDSPGGSVLGWDELRRLAGEGVALAPHGRTHALLDQLSVDEARDEVKSSLADLEREIGSAPRVFAYPAGGLTEGVVELVREEGFEIAFETIRGTNDLRRVDWLRLWRINVGRRSSLPLLRAQLLSWPVRLRAARV